MEIPENNFREGADSLLVARGSIPATRYSAVDEVSRTQSRLKISGSTTRPSNVTQRHFASTSPQVDRRVGVFLVVGEVIDRCGSGRGAL